jgi:protein disulfide-isomerase
MKLTKCFALAVFTLVAFVGSAFAQDVQWLTDYSKAVEKAKTENKVILLDFTGSDWCGWCMKLKTETFDQAQFKHYARNNLVLVEVDFPHQKTLPAPLKQQNDQLANKYGVKSYPTLVLVDKEGKELGRQKGYLEGGPKALIKELGTFYTPVTTGSGSGSSWGTSGTWGGGWK